ncbi:MAG: glycosyl transferase family 90 [Marinobacter sp.]|uniref:glycosyl transferase family 90 n=1 Tax=Marinobacter sp. TaxID=50741 RepID=UPI00349FD93C
MTIDSEFIRRLRKLAYYVRNGLWRLVPREVWQGRRRILMAQFLRSNSSPDEQAIIESRVAYYNQLSHPFSVPDNAERISDFSARGKSSAYSGDLRNLIRCFPGHLQVSYLFGDITKVPATPQFLKSRPVRSDRSNANSILLKLNTVRHYCFFRDRMAFADKKPLAVWRGKSNQPHRVEFAQRYASHPLCNVGCVLHKERQPEAYHKEFMSVDEQLHYQFIVSVEGIDVATNLKWIMASNSLCLMRRPRFETWFMEGTLVPGYHYVQLQDDHSDLVEKMEYYRQHPEEAEAIIANANRYVAQFMDARREELIALMVVEKYLQLSDQRSPQGSQLGV